MHSCNEGDKFQTLDIFDKKEQADFMENIFNKIQRRDGGSIRVDQHDKQHANRSTIYHSFMEMMGKPKKDVRHSGLNESSGVVQLAF